MARFLNKEDSKHEEMDKTPNNHNQYHAT